MKKASETNQDEILDEANLHAGAGDDWGVFVSQRLTPAEIVERLEAGLEEAPPTRGAVLAGILDLSLAGWAREKCVVRVGRRTAAVASACGHWGGEGLAMLGARSRLERAGLREEARRIFDWLFMGAPEVRALGKRVIAIGKFVGNSAFDDWSMSELGRVCGETPQAMQERMEVVCESPLRAKGSRGESDLAARGDSEGGECCGTKTIL
jgi:hypothetical protein